MINVENKIFQSAEKKPCRLFEEDISKLPINNNAYIQHMRTTTSHRARYDEVVSFVFCYEE